MPPSLATYQAVANSIYDPQQTADITTSRAATAASVANDEAEKPQIQTDYQTAVDNLTQQTNKNVGTINQLYTERLGGNFSGLQGNDLGMMFSSANKQQATIESTRANKLAAITTDETNLQNTENANESSIVSKYQGQKNQYAQESYGQAVKDYNDEQLAYAKLAASNAKSGAASSAKAGQSAAASKIAAGLNKMSGRDGYVSPYDYSAGLREWEAAGYSASEYNATFAGYKNPNTKY